MNGLSQSAVSQQVIALEKRFEVTLVERGRRRFALTPEGVVFLEAARQVLEIIENLDQRLHSLRNVVAGELRVASIFSIGLHELPPRLKTFRAKHPDVEVHVEYRRSSEVYQQVLEGNVDLGLVAFPTRRPGLQIDVFDEDELVLICHPAHPLAKKRSVPVTALNGEKFISFEPDLPTRQVIDRYLKKHQVQVAYTMEFDNIETVKRAVEIESGVSLVPSNTIRKEVEAGLLAAVHLDGQKFCRPLGIISKRNRFRAPAHKAFVEAMSEGDAEFSEVEVVPDAVVRGRKRRVAAR